eukprot:COSAG01_NODE_1142_length_11533_cov_9.907381_21_plen_207_part_00
MPPGAVRRAQCRLELVELVSHSAPHPALLGLAVEPVRRAAAGGGGGGDPAWPGGLRPVDPPPCHKAAPARVGELRQRASAAAAPPSDQERIHVSGPAQLTGPQVWCRNCSRMISGELAALCGRATLLWQRMAQRSSWHRAQSTAATRHRHTGTGRGPGPLCCCQPQAPRPQQRNSATAATAAICFFSLLPSTTQPYEYSYWQPLRL